jgi:hypothetical protein
VKNISLAAFLLLAAFPLFAQLQSVYIFQQDDTLVKRKYYNEALQKKSFLIAGLKKERSKDYKEAYNGMFEMVEDLLISPLSVTEPVADNYIKSVVGKIITANPELKKLDLRVVFSRDISPNAYSIGDGTIAFNAGLFVFLENEAEMAFAICHELAHYYLDHSGKRIDKYISLNNNDSIKKELKRVFKQEYGVGAQLEKIFKTISFDIHRHSREGEEEADRGGMRFFKNTGYNGRGIISTLQKLDKIDDTAFFKPLDLSKAFTFPGHPFKERWIKNESVIFGALNPDEALGLTKKERDSLKTHPDCARRISLLSDSAALIPGKDFQVNEALFLKLKEDFIPEMIEQVYKTGNISFNLYLSLRMLQENKHIPLAIYSVARDLNLLYKQQKEHELGLITDTENRFFDEDYNLLLRMLYRLRLYEIAELNTNFCSFYGEQMKNYEGFSEEMRKANQYKQAYQ